MFTIFPVNALCAPLKNCARVLI